MLTVTLADLRMRARQFTIAVVGATLVLSMALIMAGLSGGFRAEGARTVAEVHADGFVLPAGIGGPFGTQADLPPSLLTAVRHSPGVTAADPLVILPSGTEYSNGRQIDAHLIGVRVHGMGAPQVTAGRPLRQPGDAVADTMTGLALGQPFTEAGRRFTVVGHVSGLSYFAGTPSIYVSIQDAQSAVFHGRPDLTSIAVRGIPRAVPPGMRFMTNAEARADLLNPEKNGLTSIDVIRDFLWLVAMVIIGAVVYLSALERRRDFAVLKAIGSSTRWLYGGMALQASFIALLSGVLAIVVEPLLATLIPMRLAVSPAARGLMPVVALVIGMGASLSGLRQVVRADPALAFGGA